MIVITGASDGLGKCIAEEFMNAGKMVICLSRSKPNIAIEYIACDLTKPESIEAVAAQILDRSEPIEALINCAGVISIEPFEAARQKNIDEVMELNVKAPLLLTSRLFTRLIADNADVVNVSSTVGLKGYPEQEAYTASKWAMRGFSASLQADLKDKGVRVISFCVGGMKTNLFLKATGKSGTEKGSWMDPKDVAKLVKQLLELPKNMEVSEMVINRK